MVALLDWDLSSNTSHGAERRVFERQEVQARVEARRRDHSLAALRQPALSLVTRDLSSGGMGATSQTPIHPGEWITVFFPPQGSHRGWDAAGRVVRCKPVGSGYEVAVEFEHRAMAA